MQMAKRIQLLFTEPKLRQKNSGFLSDEGSMLETLDYTIRIGSTPTFYISICISTLPTQHTTFISDKHRQLNRFKLE